MATPRRKLVLLVVMLSCGAALAGLASCRRDTAKATAQDLASRIESAGDDERREIILTLSRRGEAAIPEIHQAFANTDKVATQMVLADSIYRMPRSEKKKEALQKMQDMAKDENVRRAIGAYIADPR